ncbi:hypothetical protein GCM10029992_01980 [Glycomyces albus]
MKTPHSPRTLKHALITALTAGIVAATLSVSPAFAQEADGLDCDAPAGGLQERGESAALELAAACGSEVLIHDSQDYTERSFAQPDGTVATEFSAVPQWVPDEDGEWVEADANVVATDDGIETTATVSNLEFGAEGEREFVTAVNADGESVSLSWPEPLPEPEVERATVVYPNVLPQVDLEVYAGVADFSYALVVKTPDAAENPSLQRIELGLATEGLSVDADAEADTAALADAAGEVAYSVAEPWMWDSSDDGAEAPPLAASMELEMDSDSLTVVPDLELLADPEAEFPIYIDPKFRDTSVAWTNFLYGESYANEIQCGNGSVMCSGLQAWENDPALGYWRAGMIFNGMQTLAGRDIRDAGVWVTQTHTAGTGRSYDVHLVAMDFFDPDAATFGNTFDEKVVGRVAKDSVPTSNENYDESNQTIAWNSSALQRRIESLVSGGANTAPFVVVSDDEGDKFQWRKMDPDSAVLLVTHAAGKPTSLKLEGGNCSSSSPGTMIDTLTPVLEAKTPDNLTANARMDFRVVKPVAGEDEVVADLHVANVAESTAYSETMLSGSLVRGQIYYWKARIRDYDDESAQNGEWSSRCYFRVNEFPQVPTETSTEGLGCGTQSSPTPVTIATPKLFATPQDADGGAVATRFGFYNEAGTLLAEWDEEGPVGLEVVTPVSSGLVGADGVYRWRARTVDGFRTSVWSAYCWVEIDTTVPEPPDVIQLTDQPLPGEPVEFELVGGDGVTGFQYVLEGQAQQSVSAADGQTKVTVTPSTSAVDHVLQVRAVDAAGNPQVRPNTGSPRSRSSRSRR